MTRSPVQTSGLAGSSHAPATSRVLSVDVCGFNTKKITIRSDLGVYIETDTFRPVPHEKSSWCSNPTTTLQMYEWRPLHSNR